MLSSSIDRVQEVRGWRTRVDRPGRPSEDYLLRKLLFCEHCGARMQGTRGGRERHRRYQCGTRRRGGDCTQTIVNAQPLEDQLVEWLRDFQPDSELRGMVIDAINAAAREQAGDDPERRRELLAQLVRLQDLYVMGDITKGQYLMRRQAMEQEVERIGPPVDPGIANAEQLLDDFARFWEIEDNPAERRKLLAQTFRAHLAGSGTIVAVKQDSPQHQPEIRGVKSGSDGTRTRDLRRDRPAL
jgi:Recombinase zinc beta ribbon domain